MATVSIQATDHECGSNTKPPFLRRVRIRGYKSIDYCDVSLQPLTILVGRNAAGKSNFLDALAFLRDLVGHGLHEAVKTHGGAEAIPMRGGNASQIAIEIESEFSCQLAPSPWTARLAIEMDFSNRLQPRIVREQLRLQANDGSHWTAFEVSGSRVTWEGEAYSPRFDEWGVRDRTLLSVFAAAPFLDFQERLRTIGTYNFVPESIRQLQKPVGTLLERDGRNLARAIECLKEIDPASVDRVREYLSSIVEDVESFEVVRYGEFETVRFRLRAAPGQQAVEFDAASMSDGTLRALAALVAAFQLGLPTDPSVIGIEEPETALHPAAIRALVDALDDATQRTQILVTTQSADLLAGRDIGPGQVLVVRSKAGRTLIAPVDQASREIVDKELYSLADLQRMDQLDQDEADLVRQARLSRNGGA